MHTTFQHSGVQYPCGCAGCLATKGLAISDITGGDTVLNRKDHNRIQHIVRQQPLPTICHNQWPYNSFLDVSFLGEHSVCIARPRDAIPDFESIVLPTRDDRLAVGREANRQNPAAVRILLLRLEFKIACTEHASCQQVREGRASWRVPSVSNFQTLRVWS